MEIKGCSNISVQLTGTKYRYIICWQWIHSRRYLTCSFILILTLPLNAIQFTKSSDFKKSHSFRDNEETLYHGALGFCWLYNSTSVGFNRLVELYHLDVVYTHVNFVHLAYISTAICTAIYSRDLKITCFFRLKKKLFIYYLAFICNFMFSFHRNSHYVIKEK